MGNSLLDLQPHIVSKDLRGYSILLYGAPKSGKTTTASHFPKSLILAFEMGYNALPGVMAKPMKSWREMKNTLRELADPQVKEMFYNVIIDTADLAYECVTKYICDQNGCMKVGDIPYGQGYGMIMKEFDETIREILKLGYGCILISHSAEKTFVDPEGKEYTKIIPTIEKRGRLVCERTCDIIGYSRVVETEDKKSVTKLFLRDNSRFMAGSRFKYTPDYIDFSYDALVNAIADAIDKEAAEYDNAFVTDKRSTNHMIEDTQLSFQDELDKFNILVSKLMAIDADSYGKEIPNIVNKYLGVGKKVMDCSSQQVDQVNLINIELETIIERLNN